MVETHTLIAPRQAERQSLQRYLFRIRTRIALGAFVPSEFLNYLTVQQQLATAIAAESRAVSDYNIALAQFEFAKGTSQAYNNVTVGEGQLPPWVSKRAADHIRERTEAAIKMREQALPPGGAAAGGHPISQPGGVSSLINLPPFAEKREPLPELSPTMPEPRNPLGPNRMPAPAPEPRPIPGAVLPGAPGAPLPLPGAGDFQPEGRVTLPPLPAGMPVDSAPPAAPPVTGTANGPNDYFGNDGRATIPQPPPYRPAPAVAPAIPITPPPTGAASGPDDFFKPDGRATLPTPPKKSGDPVWVPGQTLPPAVAAPQPPAIPPTLPPLPGGM